MELQSIIVLIVAWLWVAVPAVYFIIKGCKGDCRESEKRQTFWSAVGALVFATGICLWIYFGVSNKEPIRYIQQDIVTSIQIDSNNINDGANIK